METNLDTARRQDARSSGALRLAHGTPAHRVAILDSDSGFLLVLTRRLALAEWQHEVVAKKVSVKRIVDMELDALVVDSALLGAGRLKWLAKLCAERPDLSVIVCTASSNVAERVTALRFGVDDWLAKPCHPEELVARIEAATLRRRRNGPQEIEPTTIGEVEIRPDQFQAFVDGVSLQLTRREYQLLVLLCQSDGNVLARERIYESLWGYEMVRNDRSVDVFVHKLRRKIEQHSPGFTYIHTHFGIGYRLDARRVLETAQLAA
jgi:DNA-binding response OmpR family regulator